MHAWSQSEWGDPVAEAVGPAIELEAVLHTDQLADIRRMLRTRLRDADETELWRVSTVANELVTNALVHCGRCLGLRVFRSGSLVRIEVDDPSPVRVDPDRAGPGLRLVSDLAQSWGDRLVDRAALSAAARPNAPLPVKTVWCELRTDS